MINIVGAIKTITRLMRTITTHHRPSRLFVMSLFDSGLLEEVELERSLVMQKAGCLRVGRFVVSLSSILITFDMVGRSLGSSCTHQRPIFMHFTIDLQCKYLVGSHPLNTKSCCRSTTSKLVTVNKHWYLVKK